MKLYTVDGALLTETPELRIGDKIYKVDNRKSAVMKANDLVKADQEHADEILIRIHLGETAAKEITKMDLPLPAIKAILINLRAAIEGITYEDAEKAYFRNAGV